MRFILVLTLLLSVVQKVVAQATSKIDTLTSDEKRELNICLSKSTFNYYNLADSFSRVGDSVSASKYMLMVNPYLLFFLENCNPNSIDSFMGRFNLISSSRRQFITLFNAAFRSPRSEAYKRFQKMHDLDQSIRNEAQNCQNSECAGVIAKRRQEIDRDNSEYLYNYVVKNGWPTLENGSLFAGIIAIHDMAHYKFYWSALKKGVHSGQVDGNTFNLFSYWYSNSNRKARLTSYLNTYGYDTVDVSSMISNIEVSSKTMKKIKEIVAQNCPVKVFYIWESKDKQKFTEWCKRDDFIPWNTNVMSMLSRQLTYWNCNATTMEQRASLDGLWSCDWQPCEDTGQKMIMYITYVDPKKTSERFDTIVTNGALTTYEIHFEVNSAELQNKSLNYLNDLADWLKKNEKIQLQIAGHTDSDGSPVNNLLLSKRRADEVKRQLITYGVDNSRLTTIGFGCSKPIQSNDTFEGKAQNRRVEFIYVNSPAP